MKAKTVVLIIATLAVLAIAGMAVYDAFVDPERIVCVINGSSFGCFTPFGRLISAGAAIVLAAAAYAWERFRG